MRDHTQHPVDMMSLGFTKVAGFYPWTGYSPDFDWNYTHFWKHTIRAQYHMNGDDVINTLSEGGGKWGHGKQEARVKKSVSSSNNKLVETQYYGGYHSDVAVGYVKNRTFNIKTNNCTTDELNEYPGYLNSKSISSNQIRIGDTISIISLKNLTHYYVDWYSYNTGTYIKTDYKKTTFNGTLKLNFPTLTPDKNGNPVVWYVVHQNAYSGIRQAEVIKERHNDIFEFQPIEKDSSVVTFVNAIYPNPFQKSIIVNSLEDDVFVISTPSGSIIFSQEIHKGVNEIHIQDLPKGLYFGELKNQRFVTKLERL